MTNISNPPLEIAHDRIDPPVLDAIRRVDSAVRKHDTSYFLAGATAREIMLRHVFGRPSGRRTADVDLGIAVRDWDHFTKLKTDLIENFQFQVHPLQRQRILSPTTP